MAAGSTEIAHNPFHGHDVAADTHARGLFTGAMPMTVVVVDLIGVMLALEYGGEVRELDAFTLLGILPGFDDPTDQSCVHADLQGE
ncbi:MAG: hypothetical protein V9H69_21045 [Anaerolineae bacterium]